MNLEPDGRMKKTDAQEQLILETMGAEAAFDAITRALSIDQKEEIYSYIIRVYDLEQGEEE